MSQFQKLSRLVGQPTIARQTRAASEALQTDQQAVSGIKAAALREKEELFRLVREELEAVG